MDEEYLQVEVQVVITSGMNFRVGSPRLMYWLNAVQMPGMDDIPVHITTVVRSAPNVPMVSEDFEIDFPRISPLLDVFARCNYPGRPLTIDGVNDSTNTWSRLFLRVKLNEAESNLDVAVQSSGIDGGDTSVLRLILRELFELGNIEQIQCLEFM